MPAVLSGLIPAAHTPFDVDGRLDLSVVPRQAAHYRAMGLKAVFVVGTTGEWSSMTVQERMALCDRWTETAGADLKVAVHVGHNCREEAVTLATHARESGASAIASVAPCYFKPESAAELVEFLVPIAAAADPLPFYYYEIPSMTGSRIPASEVLREARFRIPTLRGLKFSHNDFNVLQRCINSDGGAFDVLFGQDEFLLAGLALGVGGAVGCTYNFASGHYQRLMKAYAEGDLETARARQFQAERMVEVLGKYGFMAAAKVAMAAVGVDCGPVRSPLRNLGPGDVDSLTEALKALDLLDPMS